MFAKLSSTKRSKRDRIALTRRVVRRGGGVFMRCDPFQSDCCMASSGSVFVPCAWGRLRPSWSSSRLLAGRRLLADFGRLLALHQDR